jgi:hypothetical protein
VIFSLKKVDSRRIKRDKDQIEIGQNKRLRSKYYLIWNHSIDAYCLPLIATCKSSCDLTPLAACKFMTLDPVSLPFQYIEAYSLCKRLLLPI